MAKTKVYLATPYQWRGSNEGLISWIVRWWRYRKVTKIAAIWMEKGYNIFSPITHSHPISKFADLSHAEWLEYDFQWIDACDELWVYCQPGWQTSDGVRQEVQYARNKNKEVIFLKRSGRNAYSYSYNDWL